jgi:hypothetical protein
VHILPVAPSPRRAFTRCAGLNPSSQKLQLRINGRTAPFEITDHRVAGAAFVKAVPVLQKLTSLSRHKT